MIWLFIFGLIVLMVFSRGFRKFAAWTTGIVALLCLFLYAINEAKEHARVAAEQAQAKQAQAAWDAGEPARQAQAQAAAEDAEIATLEAQRKLDALAKSPRLSDRMQTWIGHNIQEVISAMIEQPALEAGRHVGGCSVQQHFTRTNADGTGIWDSDTTVCDGGRYSYSTFGNKNGKLYIFRTTDGPASFVTDYSGAIESVKAKTSAQHDLAPKAK
jgi:hypothetical protein